MKLDFSLVRLELWAKGMQRWDEELLLASQAQSVLTLAFSFNAGIGWKSVFLISDAPEVHSRGYHVKFDRNGTEDCKLGFIVPEWWVIVDSLVLMLIWASGLKAAASAVVTTNQG